MSYIDFVSIPLPEQHLDEYTKQIEIFASVMKANGVLSYCEARADDVARGKVTDWYRSVDCKDGETVVVAYMKWTDKATRDKGWEEVMKDPRLADMMNPEKSLMDGKRMIWGGFSPLVEF